MTADSATVIGVWTGVAVSIGTGIFVYGRLTEKVDGHDKRLTRVEDRGDGHEKRIAYLEGKAHVR